MASIRRPLVAALLAAAALPGAAAAGPRVYCNLVRGDDAYESPEETVLPGSTQHVRIKSADVATNAKHLTAVVRLRTMRGTDPTQALQGLRATFWFSAQGAENDYYDVIADLGRVNTFWVESADVDFYGAGPAFAYNGTVNKVGDAVGVVDVKRAEIRITVPLTVFHRGPGGVRKGTSLSGFGASVLQKFGDHPGAPASVTYAGLHRDGVEAPAHVRYPVGAPSCVPVGR
jgi:hypothetical protein